MKRKWKDLRRAVELRKENLILFKYLRKKKNINPWTRILVEQIIKLNMNIIDDIIK